jgi:hypothetical protein
MRPAVPFVLEGALATVRELEEHAGDVRDLGQLRAIEMLLILLQQEWDSAAAKRAAVIAGYTGALTQGAKITAGSLQSNLRRTLDTVAQSAGCLSVSSLEDRLDLLRAAAIDLQSWLETSDEPEAEAVLADLWRVEYDDANSRVGLEALW